MSTRNIHQSEAEALKELLLYALPKTGVNALTNVAIEHAKAVRAAFDELAKPASS
ncbi:hypothetical protein [Pseudomonas sp. BGI-2]|uniref:hypothetical protein n=1 Tax=Pseudomonas sp. BGI-2 TaxID=2528211 RepID=UPI0013F49029|nr:hypothetical protein [Pseudomonas sp. BGI-2]